MEKIQQFSLRQLNNTEYANFMRRVRSLIEAAGPGNLKIEAPLLDAFAKNHERMLDAVARVTARAETARLAEIDPKRDALITYAFNIVRNAASSPYASEAGAGQVLLRIVNTYKGIQQLPNQQETQRIEGLLYDLAKPEPAWAVATLKLDEAFNDLRALNGQYAQLTEQRTNAAEAENIDAGKTVRKEMDGQYDEITAYAQAAALLFPSEAAAAFIRQMNALIDEIRSLNRQRLAQKAAAGTPGTPDTTGGTAPEEGTEGSA